MYQNCTIPETLPDGRVFQQQFFQQVLGERMQLFKIQQQKVTDIMCSLDQMPSTEGVVDLRREAQRLQERLAGKWYDSVRDINDETQKVTSDIQALVESIKMCLHSCARNDET